MSNTKLPWVSSNIPPDLRQFLERVRETLGGNEFVRRMDYLSGTIPRNATDPVDPMPPPPPGRTCGAAVTPTAPTGFLVDAGFTGFLLQWDMPGYCGHSHTEVYGLRRDGTSAELGVQNMLGESAGIMYSHVVNIPEDYWCFWIKHVNVNDVEGPFVGAPVCAKTAIDPGAIIEVLKGAISESELYHTLGDKIDLIDTSVALSKIVAELSVKNRAFYADAAPSAAAYTLVAGDLWFDTDDGNRLYSYTSDLMWVPVPETAYGTLQTQITTEQTERQDADSAEAYRREALVAGSFAGIGNSYKFFVQAAQPTASQVGDMWSWTDANGVETFKRWNGTTWISDVPTPATEYQRAAKYWGESDEPPTVGPFQIGDIYTDTDEAGYPTKVYTGIVGNLWQVRTLYAPELSAAVTQEQRARVDADGALAQEIGIVAAQAGDAAAAVVDIETSKIGYCSAAASPYATTAQGDRASCEAAGNVWNLGLPWATAVKQVSVTYNGQTAVLEQQFSALSTDVGGLEAQYTVKVDNQGYISGFGLASTPVNGVPFSDFQVRADRFSIANPTTPDPGYQTDPTIPFTVTTTGQTIGGVYVPPGTYIKDGYIQNGTITNAKIADATIDNAKILSLSADKIRAGSIIANQYIQSANYQPGVLGAGWKVGTSSSGLGYGEFDYLVLRSGAVSYIRGGTRLSNSGSMFYREGRLLAYADVDYPDTLTSGVFLFAQFSLNRVGTSPLAGYNTADARAFLLREWPVAEYPGVCTKNGYTDASSCQLAGGTWFSESTYCSNMTFTTATACQANYETWVGTAPVTNMSVIASLDVTLPMVRPGVVNIQEADILGLAAAQIASSLNARINADLNANAYFWGQNGGFVSDKPTFTSNNPPMYQTGDPRRRVRYWLALYHIGENSASTNINYTAQNLAVAFLKR